MKATITITNDEGQVVCHQEFDPRLPKQWKTPTDQPLTETQIGQGPNSQIVWQLYGWTFQPMVQRSLRRV